MDVILLERIEKLGQMGDVVTVKPGFARNYLLPRKKALRATEANRAVFDEQRAQLEAENLKHREEAERVAKDMDGMTVATELPITTGRFFEEQGVNVNVEYSWGTTEVKAKGKLVDGIVDITETGSSLRANNLKIVDTIMESTTRFIANKEAWEDPAREQTSLMLR